MKNMICSTCVMIMMSLTLIEAVAMETVDLSITEAAKAAAEAEIAEIDAGAIRMKEGLAKKPHPMNKIVVYLIDENAKTLKEMIKVKMEIAAITNATSPETIAALKKDNTKWERITEYRCLSYAGVREKSKRRNSKVCFARFQQK